MWKHGLRFVGVVVVVGLASCTGVESDRRSQSATVPPSNIIATAAGPTSIALAWSVVANARKYYVFRSHDSKPFNYITTVLDPGASFVATDLEPATTYSFQLQSVDLDGTESEFSAPVDATTLAADANTPTDLIASTISDTAIELSWNAVSGAFKYYILISTADEAFRYFSTVLAPDTEFVATGLTPNTTYTFEVVAVLTDGSEWPPSLPATETTLESIDSLAPVFQPLVAPAGSIQGYWNFDEKTGTTANDQSGFGRNATLATGATFGTTSKPPIDDDASTLAYTNATTAAANVPANSAFDLTGSFSVVFWAMLPAGVATHFVGIRASGCGTTTWEIRQNRNNQLHFVGPGGQVLSFGATLTNNVWTHVGVTYSGGTMRLYLNGVQVASGAYTPGGVSGRPLAMGHVGGCTGRPAFMDEVLIYSRALTATEVASLGTVPPAPTVLAIASKTSATMNLTWTAISGVEKHVVEKGTAAGNEVFYTHSPATASFAADHLSPSTQYSWRIRSVRNGLYSAPSTEVIGTTNAPPTAPTGVTATLVSSNRIQVSWNSVSSAVKYYVFQSVAGGPFTFQGSVVAPATSLLVANLSAATTYAYQVQAEDSSQVVSANSASASTTTP